MSQYYNQGWLEFRNGTIQYLVDDIHVMLLSSTYVFNPNHTAVSDLASHEINVSGYVPGFGQPGRIAITGKLTQADLSLNRILYKCNSVTWATLGAGAQVGGVAFIRQITSDALSRPIGVLTGTPKNTDGSDFPIVWPTDGWARERPAPAS